MEWKISESPVSYQEAVMAMESRVAAMLAGEAGEMGWLLEHPPLYTAGTSAKQSDLLEKNRFPVYASGRGGQYTYHGPGQRVAYLMLDLNRRGRDLRAYVRMLERCIIDTLWQFGVEGFTREGRTGVWVNDGTEKKIAAIGIRVRKWIAYHGISLNLNTDLSHYAGIIPCGIDQYGVTSLASLGISATMADLDAALQCSFTAVFP